MPYCALNPFFSDHGEGRVYRTRVRSLVMLVTPSDSCLINLIDVTLACEDANSKLVEVANVANVDDEDHVGNSLLHTWDLGLGNKAKLLLRLSAQGFEVKAGFLSWSLVNILPLMFCRGYEDESWFRC